MQNRLTVVAVLVPAVAIGRRRRKRKTRREKKKDKEKKRQQKEKEKERERIKSEREQEKTDKANESLRQKNITAAAKNADTLLKKTLKTYNTMSQTKQSPLAEFIPPSTKDQLNELLTALTKMRKDAEDAKTNSVENFSFDKPQVDKLCAQGNKADAYVRDMFDSIGGMQQINRPL